LDAFPCVCAALSSLCSLQSVLFAVCALCSLCSLQTCFCTVHPHAFCSSGRVPAPRIMQNASGFLIFSLAIVLEMGANSVLCCSRSQMMMMKKKPYLPGQAGAAGVDEAGAAAGAAVQGVREERSASSSKGVSRFLYRKRWGLQSFCPLDWHNMSSARVRATHRHTLVHSSASQRASHSSASRDSLNTSLSQMVGLTRAALCRLPLPLHSTIIITLPRISHTHPRTHSRTNRNFVYNF